MDAELMDRGVPDVVDTATLPPLLAAELDHLAGRPSRWTEPGAHHPATAARARAALGDVEGARRLLISSGDPATWPLPAMVAGAWAASRVGPGETVQRLLECMTGAGAEGFLLADGVPLGPSSATTGMLRLALGDQVAAVRELTDAVAVGDRRAPVWGALARLELARALLGGSEPDRHAARAVVEAARLFFAAGGYRHLSGVVAALDAPDPRRAPAAPGLGHLVEGTDRWTVGFGAAPPVDVPDALGLHLLARLVDDAPVAVSAVELDLLAAGRPVRPLIEELRAQQERGGVEAVAERLRDDRARSRVSKLLRRTIDRLRQQHPYLGAHLAARVETGYRCRYDGAGVRWRRHPG